MKKLEPDWCKNALDKEYKVIDVKHELICVGSIIQTNKVILIVNEIRHDLYT